MAPASQVDPEDLAAGDIYPDKCLSVTDVIHFWSAVLLVHVRILNATVMSCPLEYNSQPLP